MIDAFLSWPMWGVEVFGNAVRAYAMAAAGIVVLLIVFRIVQRVILAQIAKFAKRSETDIDDVFVEIVQSLNPPFYSFLAVYFAVRTLVLGDWVRELLDAALIIWVTYQVITAVQILINFVATRAMGKDNDAQGQAAAHLLGSIAKGVLWVIGGLLILSNLGVNITSLIAGLGIGGVAIALALQNILADLFSSFSIYFDKPFNVGDFIVAGEHSGTVKRIGVKTTRIKALQGEEIVIGNQELTNARIQNFGRMDRRRVSNTFGVTYDTSNEKLAKIPGMVKGLFENMKHVSFDRAHFSSFDDSALVFEYVYSVETADYTEYMDIQQAFNLGLKAAFEEEGIEFAYPTQTLHMIQKEDDTHNS